MKHFVYAEEGRGLNEAAIREAVLTAIRGRELHKVLLLPPDFTRYHSNAGLITNIYYHTLKEQGCQVDILPAIGTHMPVSREEASIMFGDIPYEELLVHNWRTDVVKLGEVPGDFLAEKTEGLWSEPISVEVNRRLMDPSYDLILSIGQVVPHVVVGMANQSKNLFVGIGGSDMINKSHMVGAIYGLERILGRDHTPVRELFDYAFEHYLGSLPILFVLTVCTVANHEICTHGIFIGEGREPLNAAVELAQKTNIIFVPHGLKKCVAWMDPNEFKSTWVGNKAIYRTRMAIEDGGELIIMAPGLRTYGEDAIVDALIRKYGYSGRMHILELFNNPENEDLRQNMGAAAHLIHGSVDGRFRVIYAVEPSMMEGVKAVGFDVMSIHDAMKKYNPEKLQSGYQTLDDGEEIYFIPTPAIGLWINREKF